MERLFDLGDILSITHDRLVSERHMEGVYDICNFLTQDNLFTHQLVRVHDECRAWLLTLHPQLAELPTVDKDRDMSGCWREWLAEQKARYGDSLEVTPIPKGIHEYKDPIAEAEELVGKDRVVVIRKED